MKKSGSNTQSCFNAKFPKNALFSTSTTHTFLASIFNIQNKTQLVMKNMCNLKAARDRWLKGCITKSCLVHKLYNFLFSSNMSLPFHKDLFHSPYKLSLSYFFFIHIKTQIDFLKTNDNFAFYRNGML